MLVDSYEDCPAAFGPHATQLISARLPGAAVMAVREFESWLLQTFGESELAACGIVDPEQASDAKGSLGRLVPGYAPTTHQLEIVRRVDVAALSERSASFAKLVRDLDRITR